MVKTRSLPAENFFIGSIKAVCVYSRIMIVVNKLMLPPRSHGVNVNIRGDNGSKRGGVTLQRNNLKTTVISDGGFQ